MTAEALTGPELVARIHTRKRDMLTEDLVRQEAHYDRLLTEAQALGTSPGAVMAWELVHEAAGNTARTKSRLTQLRWTT